MSKLPVSFVSFCRQHRCYCDLEQYFSKMDKSYLLRMTRLNTLGKLSFWHPFVVRARRFEFVTRHLRRLYECGFYDVSNAVGTYDVCGVIRCSDCWYERG